MPTSSPKFLLNARVKEFIVPPITDGLVLGKDAPIGVAALKKALKVLVPDTFEHFEVSDDEVLSDLLVKSALVRRLTKERLLGFVLQHIKPFMTSEDIFHVQLDAEILISEELA